MKSMKKFVCMILVLTLVFLIASIASTASTDENIFSGSIQLEIGADAVDLSGVKIDVYSSQAQEKTASWLNVYDHIYAFTIQTDASGAFAFVAPSPNFYFEVQLDTLPVGFGINKTSRMYHIDETCSEVLQLSAISDISLDAYSLNGGHTVHLLDSNGNEVFADYEFDPVYEAQSSDLTSVTISGTVKIGEDLAFETAATIDLTGIDPTDRIEQLYNAA